MKTKLIIFIFILVAPHLVNAKTHKKVQAALDYDMPENTCKKPTKFASTKATGTAPTQSSSGVDKYKAGLLKDMDTLKASAQHGLTQAQADTIIDNMRGIQDVYMTPDGVLDPAISSTTKAPATP